MFGAWAQFVICGACKFDWKYMDLNGDFSPAIQIVAVNTKTNQHYSGRVGRRGFMTHPPPQPGDDKRQVAIGTYFNPNLTLITNVPKEEAEYRIHATLGSYKSNTVTVLLKRQKP